MTKMSATYLGNLRIESIHQKSGTKLVTDAPTDNHGKGECFSPTDLLATALMNCMITIIGIYCNNNNYLFTYCEAEIEKIMVNTPRRVGGLNLTLDLSKNNWNKEERKHIEAAGRACPVAKSISKDIAIHLVFKYD